MIDEIQELKEKRDELAKVFKLEELKKEVEKLDEESSKPGFWDDAQKAADVQQRRSEAAETLEIFATIDTDLSDAEEFAPMIEEGGDADIEKEVAGKLRSAKKSLDELEFRRMLSGKFDASAAILSINSGAGGTEAQDWVQILLRMYLRWAERQGYQSTVVDQLPGEEAGLKNCTIIIEGDHAYGYLKSEAGVHRLVRISPFDSNSRRHTSFASVLVMPQIEDDIEVEIRDEDLRVDTYRSSGAGGQHVNKTDSAVRLTHIPSGIVVACQNERSQHKNKAQAMKILRARLYEKQEEERRQEREKIAGEKKNINFGSQIRSYVMQPYQMVKDLRTGFEMGNVQGVLDGDLGGFIRSYLLHASAPSQD